MFKKVGIIGLGYVGLPLVIEFSKAGYQVTGFDIDQKKVDQLNQGQSYISYIQAEDIANLVGKKQLFATTDYNLLK